MALRELNVIPQTCKLDLTSINFVYFFLSATVDLSDESGNLKFLVNHPLIYATELLKERESFVLIRVESKLVTDKLNSPVDWIVYSL